MARQERKDELLARAIVIDVCKEWYCASARRRMFGRDQCVLQAKNMQVVQSKTGRSWLETLF